MRPSYESDADRERECAVASKLAALAQMEVRLMPRRYPVDFALVDRRDNVRCWIEVKCRTNLREAFPTYMLSYGKYLTLAELQRVSGLPVRLAVQWSDDLGVLEIPAMHRISFGGRADRGDWQDQEPVALFEIGLFRVVE